MRALTLLFALASPIAGAKCVATAQDLLLLEVAACQAITLEGDPAHGGGRHPAQTSGVLLTARVREARKVVQDSASDHPVQQGPVVSGGQWANFFVDAAASRCPTLRAGSPRWFITVPRCCDVLPPRGKCVLPGTLQEVRPEPRPERWHPWSPAGRQDD